MLAILEDVCKFELFGPIVGNDKTQTIENNIRNYLLKVNKNKEIEKSDLEFMRPTGSQLPRIYGLTKVHKKNNPLRPILSMVDSPQHKIAKWLSNLLRPVLKKYTKECISDSFSFAKFIQSRRLTPSDFLCSFDIKSLFTCVPVNEVVDICADALYREGLAVNGLEETSFRELMKIATTSVEFLFDGNIYRQIDGVAMGSPLGPTLANIFVGY